MTADPDQIADVVLRQFQKLPAKRRPQVRDNGLHEWVPLSGIVAEKDGVLTCLSLATGMKCLPASKLSLAKGNALHDWHAEVLAIRAFNRWLLDECSSHLQGTASEFIRRREASEVSNDSPQPFAVKDGVKLHMYCSEAPCGDASMELTMAAQDDASPWEVPPAPTPTPTLNATSGPETAVTASDVGSLPGRAYFSQLGVVRRKPARGDAPPTMSKSCSDKLALKQCTSLLSSLAVLLVHPGNAYISALVLPDSQRSVEGCERAFSARGRMRALAGRRWQGGYRFSPFEVATTAREFGFSRRTVGARAERVAASNLAAASTASGVDEGTMGGVLQGRKAFDAKGASAVSRRRMWELAAALAGSLGPDGEALRRAVEVDTYAQVKGGDLLADRREVKESARKEGLAGWVVNVGDDNFSRP
ncbi:adenosine-deaminase domain-containing protein [Colletotrichum graminicola M1.001]|uniref:Adenosine-deaminase domain-containing protein n=1 Tax=Colletotrichum graminicola (strain M1.001 / M2 / FGSC 10212) TaxID=645133 RepID=E3QFD3_COLGM|nr:adenosine-deaminase domain-containing protein [Colletotrichum graminicola M1.001]EFQ29571.1 adenosine-deaminase domain-containing protein [Colletotrichum graminicola M1.001]